MEIREATLADESDICRLWMMLLKFYQKDARKEVLQRSFRYAINNPQKILIFAGLIEGKLIGTVSLHLGHYSTWSDRWYGHAEDLIVDPEYRGRGAALALMEQVIAVARDQKLCRVELNALADNSTARRLYQKLGFATNSVVYELTL